jgi:hypothetical protein
LQQANEEQNLDRYHEKFQPTVRSSEGIDKIIITNNVSANQMVKKVQKFKLTPIFYLDEQGNKVPLKDEQGNVIVDENGVVQYAIAELKQEPDGFMAVAEYCSASEPFSPDLSSTYLDEKWCDLIIELGWYYNYYQRLQMNGSEDYSFELHQLVNDINFVALTRKSYLGGSVSAVKTFRTIEEGKQEQIFKEEQKRRGVLGGLNETLWGKGAPPPKQQRPFYV